MSQTNQETPTAQAGYPNTTTDAAYYNAAWSQYYQYQASVAQQANPQTPGYPQYQAQAQYNQATTTPMQTYGQQPQTVNPYLVNYYQYPNPYGYYPYAMVDYFSLSLFI